jgi:hypothetical protein
VPNTVASGLPHPQSYDLGDPDVVVDRVTGLSWQRVADPASYNHYQASDYCSALKLSGHRDWRLPSWMELTSIADTSQADPAVDQVAFPSTPAATFWSSQTDVTNTGLGWYVSFKNGGAYGGDDVVRLARVRCVRGYSSCAESEVSDYSLTSEVATDIHTGLGWRRTVEPENFVWKDANRFCSKLAAQGAAWRLPSLRELLTLVDLTRYDPAIDRVAFKDTPSEFFWSSSPSRAPEGSAWGVNFTRGSSAVAPITTKAHVRCVRQSIE